MVKTSRSSQSPSFILPFSPSFPKAWDNCPIYFGGVAAERRLSERMARNLLKDWVKDGWLEVANPSRRARSYSLSAKYRQYIGSLSAMPDGGNENEP